MKSRSLSFLLIIVAIVMVAGILAVDRYREASSLEGEIATFHNSQEGYVIQVAQKVELTVSRLFSHLYLLSQSPQVQFMEKNTCLLNLVRTFELNRGMVNGIYRYDKDHVQRYGFPLGNNPVSGTALDELFKQTRISGRSMVQVIRIRRDSTDYIVLAQPVYTVQGEVHLNPSNKYSGTLVFIISLDYLQNRLFPSLSFGKRGYPWIIDENGLLLITANDAHRGRLFSEFLPSELPAGEEESLMKIIDKMRRGESGSGRYSFAMHRNVPKKIEKLTSFVPIRLPHTQWSVAVATPLEDVTDGFHKRSWEHRFVTYIALLVVVAMTAMLLIGLRGSYRQQLYRLRRKEEKARQLKDEWQLIFDAIDQMIFLLDDRLRIVRTNRQVWSVTGRTANDLKGLCVPDLLFYSETLEEPEKKPEVLHARQVIRVESDILKKTLLVTTAPISGMIDNKAKFICLVKDITDLEEMQIRLNNSRKMEAIATLAGGVAHDLNNILSGVVSYPDLMLLKMADDDPMRGPLVAIQNSGRRAVAVVGDLLLLANRGGGSKAVLNLNHIIEDFFRSTEFIALEKQRDSVVVKKQLAADLRNIRGSAPHLTTILMNITKNSIDAFAGTGTVTVRTENIDYGEQPEELSEIPAGRYVQLVISDTGSGIEMSDLDRIFEPFFTKKILGRSGTGLGMAVVWGTVHDHGGTISLSSVPGEGTSVTIILPATDEQLDTADGEGGGSLRFGNGQMILIVDDNEEQRHIGSMMCEKLGYRSDTVASGEEALCWLDSRQADLIMLDMIMGAGLDGLATYHKIREQRPGQKVIIVSGYAQEERIHEAMNSGILHYLKKPYSVRELAETLAESLGGSI